MCNGLFHIAVKRHCVSRCVLRSSRIRHRQSDSPADPGGLRRTAHAQGAARPLRGVKAAFRYRAGVPPRPTGGVHRAQRILLRARLI